ncbi:MULTISPECIES: YafY family protein [unclassified Acinetobacter]|uniref:helix-turn-helix transcriptional regulator n=1 Tax=unclassified Acinetobacter TaxID=196816 RepID=UPI0015D4652B|nr:MULTISPECIES: WYL domain-containing protein [unclassified Acinetobacter]UUS58467.1 WYL domain-containing protein [Acinetobacter sp. YH16040_T]
MKKIQSKLINRILALYKIIPRFPQEQVSISTLKKKVSSNYSECIDELSLIKAIRRDLDLLPELLISGELILKVGKGNQPATYQLSQDACIEPMSKELALILVMANEYLHHSLPDEIYTKVEGFFQSAELQLQQNTKLNGWNKRVRFIPDGYGEIEKAQHHIEIQQLVYKALLQGDVWLKAKYRKEGTQQIGNYTLKPQGIVQFGQKPYLMASKIDSKKSVLRTFNILNFEFLEIVPEKIAIDIDAYDLDDLIEKREFEDAYFNREEIDIFFVFQEILLDELTRNPLGDCQSIVKIDEGYYELNTSCIFTMSRMDWLIQNAEYIQIIGPDELKEEVADRIMRAAEKHEVFNQLNFGDYE